jgi:hypothetical protein
MQPLVLAFAAILTAGICSSSVQADAAASARFCIASLLALAVLHCKQMHLFCWLLQRFTVSNAASSAGFCCALLQANEAASAGFCSASL